KLQFFGNDPQNTSVERGKTALVNCRVQTNDPTTKFSGSEQYENIEQSQELQSQQYSNNILSKSLFFSSITSKEGGQYICLVQNDKATNYRKAFINVIDNHEGKINGTWLYINSERTKTRM
ncbi:unnamed protein product, partial [Rotaria sp. Silwood2]